LNHAEAFDDAAKQHCMDLEFLMNNQQTYRQDGRSQLSASTTGLSWRSKEVVWLRSCLRRYKKNYIVLVVLAGMSGFVVIIDPLIMRWVLDVLIPSHGGALFPFAAALFLLSYVGRVFFDQKTGILSARLTHGGMVVLRLNILRRLLQLPAEYHDRAPLGKTLFHVNEDVRQLADAGPSVLVEITRVAVGTSATLMTMLWVNPRVTLVIIPLIVVHTALKRYWNKGVLHASELVQKEFATVAALTQQITAGAVPIQLLGCQTTMLKRFVRQGRRARDSFVARRLWDSRFTLLSRGSVVAGMAVVLGYGGFLVSRGALTIGALVALYTFMVRICEPLAQIVDLDSRYEKARASLRNLYQIVCCSFEATGRSRVSAPSTSRASGNVEFRNVTFGYRGRPTLLHDVSFSIAAGQHVVFTGQTGSGKTTLLRLLLHLYSGYQGTIHLDDIEISQIPFTLLRATFSVVAQEAFLFDASLRENLLLANRTASPQQLDEAIECSQLEPLAHRLPLGLNQFVGPQGAELSGGEKQRVALARALLQRRPILLLDEFTSALDELTEQKILRALNHSTDNRTVIAISHRAKVISWADRVMLLKAGRIVNEQTRAAFARSHSRSTDSLDEAVFHDQ
jgi:ABC-type multidrug transport system fused ATPase/permease subunit